MTRNKIFVPTLIWVKNDRFDQKFVSKNRNLTKKWSIRQWKTSFARWKSKKKYTVDSAKMKIDLLSPYFIDRNKINQIYWLIRMKDYFLSKKLRYLKIMENFKIKKTSKSMKLVGDSLVFTPSFYNLQIILNRVGLRWLINFKLKFLSHWFLTGGKTEILVLKIQKFYLVEKRTLFQHKPVSTPLILLFHLLYFKWLTS